jgi:hypothetical protein
MFVASIACIRDQGLLTHEFQVELLQRISTIESRLAELSGQTSRNE